jgi:hypothetical protein
MKIKDLVNESGLSRIFQLIQAHDYGTITAYRYAPDCGTGEPYSYKQNQQRNQSLLAKLRVAGYGVISIKGSYIENYGSADAREVGENSFLVVDVQDKGTLKNTLLALGEEFDQDSIIFGKAGDTGVLIGTNSCPGGYPGPGKEVVQGGAIFGKTGEFMSRVNGRPFVFAEDTELVQYGIAKYPTELRGLVEQSRTPWPELVVLANQRT